MPRKRHSAARSVTLRLRYDEMRRDSATSRRLIARLLITPARYCHAIMRDDDGDVTATATSLLSAAHDTLYHGDADAHVMMLSDIILR